jgi:hypothetical protein
MSKVRAKVGGFVGHEGIPVLLVEGEERDSEDSLVQARPDLFTEPPRRPVLRGKKPAEEPPAPPKAPVKGKGVGG